MQVRHSSSWCLEDLPWLSSLFLNNSHPHSPRESRFHCFALCSRNTARSAPQQGLSTLFLQCGKLVPGTLLS